MHEKCTEEIILKPFFVLGFASQFRPILIVSELRVNFEDLMIADQNTADTPAESWNETMSNKVRIMVGFW